MIGRECKRLQEKIVDILAANNVHRAEALSGAGIEIQLAIIVLVYREKVGQLLKKNECTTVEADSEFYCKGELYT